MGQPKCGCSTMEVLVGLSRCAGKIRDSFANRWKIMPRWNSSHVGVFCATHCLLNTELSHLRLAVLVALDLLGDGNRPQEFITMVMSDHLLSRLSALLSRCYWIAVNFRGRFWICGSIALPRVISRASMYKTSRQAPSIFRVGCIFRFMILVSTSTGLQSLYAPGFLGFLRLENTNIMAYNHNPNNGTTTGIILQAHEGEVKTIKEQILFHESFISHRLLLRTIITEMSLQDSEKQTSEVKQNIMDIEDSTGQHTWDDYIARDEKPKSDVELSKEVHGLKIQTAVIYRRIEAVSIWTELLLESLTPDQEDSAIRTSMLQWLRNLKIQVKMAKLDVELLTKRAENQVGAVSTAYLS